MGIFAKGQVIVAPLNFSDFSGNKRRPALVIAAPDRLDPILCLITSKPRSDGYDVQITEADFSSGGLRVISYIRVCHLFTVESNLIEYCAGTLKPSKTAQVTSKIIELVSRQ